MFRRIFVPLDGSSFAEHALPFAAKVARAQGAEIDLALVHISYTPVTADLALREAIQEWEEQSRTRETQYLQDMAERLKGETGLGVRPVLLHGDIADTLEHEIRETGADLVVMTTHGRAGLERAWLGSVADALIRHVEPPILLIRPGEARPAAGAAEPRFQHVLVALDGSDRAERAIAPALALARADQARVTLFRSASPPRAVASPYIPHVIELTHEEVEQREEEARTYVREQVERLAGGGLDIRGVSVLDYHPAHAILSYARENDADLIALGTHGRRPVARLVLGSVSDKVVRAADVPVLVC